MIPKWQNGQVESDVADGRIRFENGDDGAEGETEQRHVVVESQRQRYDVDERVQLEDAGEEQVKVVEHLRKEIPKEANVRRQIRHFQSINYKN